MVLAKGNYCYKEKVTTIVIFTFLLIFLFSYSVDISILLAFPGPPDICHSHVKLWLTPCRAQSLLSTGSTIKKSYRTSCSVPTKLTIINTVIVITDVNLCANVKTIAIRFAGQRRFFVTNRNRST